MWLCHLSFNFFQLLFSYIRQGIYRSCWYLGCCYYASQYLFTFCFSPSKKKNIWKSKKQEWKRVLPSQICLKYSFFFFVSERHRKVVVLVVLETLQHCSINKRRAPCLLVSDRLIIPLLPPFEVLLKWWHQEVSKSKKK